MRYTISQVIQSPNNPPVDVSWGKNVSAVEAAARLAMIVAKAEEIDNSVPASVRPITLQINVVLNGDGPLGEGCPYDDPTCRPADTCVSCCIDLTRSAN